MYFTSGAIARDSAYFGQGSGSILLDNVHCIGNETSIFSCSHNSIGSHNCVHSEDAGVDCSCKNEIILITIVLCLLLAVGIVRLYRNGLTSSSYYYGIVQIWYNGLWGNICDDSYYDQYEADVICHQLGYTGASSYYRAGLMRLVNDLKLLLFSI